MPHEFAPELARLKLAKIEEVGFTDTTGPTQGRLVRPPDRQAATTD